LPLLRLAFPAAAAALAAGALAQVSAPAAFLTGAWGACPCPHIQTAAQLIGAGTALPAAAAAALASAAEAGPSRLASPTYTRLAAGLAAWAALTAAGLTLAAPRLALAPWYKGSAAAGLAALGAAAGVAAAAYAPGGAQAAVGAVPATLRTAATLDRACAPPLARAYGGLSTAAAVGAAYAAATAAIAAASPAPPPVRVVLAFSATAAALFAAIATGVLADAVARGRGGASTFVALAKGGAVGGGVAVGALAGMVGRGGRAGGVVPLMACAVWVVALAGVCGWHVCVGGEAV
jgi:hypothetical protein